MEKIRKLMHDMWQEWKEEMRKFRKEQQSIQNELKRIIIENFDIMEKKQREKKKNVML